MDTQEPLPCLLARPAWWSRVIDAWNVYDRRHVLAGVGTARFTITDVPISITIRWDQNGVAEKLPDVEGDTGLVAFAIEGNCSSWCAFIHGTFSAAASVLTRRLFFRGPFSLGLRYSRGFDELAAVSRQIVAVKPLS